MAAAPAWWSGSAGRIAGLLSSAGYLASEHTCAVLGLAGQLGKPVLVEEAGRYGEDRAGYQPGGRDRQQADPAAVSRGPG